MAFCSKNLFWIFCLILCMTGLYFGKDSLECRNQIEKKMRQFISDEKSQLETSMEHYDLEPFIAALHVNCILKHLSDSYSKFAGMLGVKYFKPN